MQIKLMHDFSYIFQGHMHIKNLLCHKNHLYIEIKYKIATVIFLLHKM